MNAVISLCHFCDSHGPRPIFCTFTTQENKQKFDERRSYSFCKACTSIGNGEEFICKDNDGLMYCSRERMNSDEIMTLLTNAAVRSLTCEVNWNKDGGIIYFDVGVYAHVLSISFQLQDSMARGLKRWFSFVILMKEKMLLLNLLPLISDNIEKIITQLGLSANQVYKKDQNVCSQRALRLNSGTNDFGPLRNLIELTDDDKVFEKLHTSLTWLLKAGSIKYTENIYNSHSLLSEWDNNTSIGRSIVFNENEIDTSFRDIKNVLTEEIFKKVLYSVLCCVKLFIIGDSKMCKDFELNLNSLLPSTTNHPSNCSIIILISKTNVDKITSNCKSYCILREKNNNVFECLCTETIPSKCPTLMVKIEDAIKNTRFSDLILGHHIKSLLLEWFNICQTLKKATNVSNAKDTVIVDLKKALNVASHDARLVQNWISHFCK